MTCNAVCPGYMLTELVEKQLAATAKLRGMSEVRRTRCFRGQGLSPTQEALAVGSDTMPSFSGRMRSCRRCYWRISQRRRSSALMR